MTLIQRNNASESKTLSISSADSHRDDCVRENKSAPRPAFLPTLLELQAVCARMIADPDLSQSNMFNFTAPLFIFISLLSAGVLIPRHSAPNAVATGIPGDIINHNTDVGLAVLASIVIITVGLAILRVVILGFALAASAFVAMDLGQGVENSSSDEEFQLTRASVVLGTMFS